jgi:HEAT repeat protein
MPLLESKIKQAILHPEEEVRLTALGYFAGSHTADETIMPLVIEAVKKYGWEEAFRLLRDGDDLPQTAATVAWLTGELSKDDWDFEDVVADNYATAIALTLSQARADLLRPEMVDLPGFPEELETEFLDRLEMQSWDWETGWEAFEDLGREVYGEGSYRNRDMRRARRIIESLARHREQGRLILPLLERRYRGYEKDLMWVLEPALVELAGRMRLEEAVPILLERLYEDDLDLSDSCQTALQWIGGDAVVRSIAGQWPDAEEEFRTYGAEILEGIHTELCVRKCLEFFRAEESPEVRDYLAHALLGNFVAEAVEPIRQMVQDAEDLDPEIMDLRHCLVAACTLMEVSFPEYERWYKEAREQQWGWGDGLEPDRIREHLGDDDDEDDLDDDEDEDEEDGEYDEYDDDAIDDEIRDEDEDRLREKFARFERAGPKLGRNDPCPCGSGKKYKKCCMKNDQPEP